MNALDVFNAISAPPARPRPEPAPARTERKQDTAFDDAIRSARETYASEDASNVVAKDNAAEPERNESQTADAPNAKGNAADKDGDAKDSRDVKSSDNKSTDAAPTDGKKTASAPNNDGQSASNDASATTATANKAATYAATGTTVVTQSATDVRGVFDAGPRLADATRDRQPQTESRNFDPAQLGGRITTSVNTGQGTSTGATGGQAEPSTPNTTTTQQQSNNNEAATQQSTADASATDAKATTNPLLQNNAAQTNADNAAAQSAAAQAQSADVDRAAQQPTTRDERHTLKTQESTDAAAAQRSENNNSAPQRSAPSPAVELAKALLPEAHVEHASGHNSGAAHAADAGAQSTGQAPIGTIGGTDTGGAHVRAATVVEVRDTAGTTVQTADLFDANAPADRLTKLISSSVTPRTSYIKLQLDPPELGQLRLEVRLQDNALTIRAEADSVAVKNLIEERIGDLKHALHQQGVRVDRVDVEVRNTNHTSNESRDETGQRHASARQDAGQQQHSSESSAWERHASGGSETELADPARIADPAESGPIAQVTTESSVDVLV